MKFLNVLKLTIALLPLNACSLHVDRANPIGAGIIAFACKDDSALYLLARERVLNRIGWGHLGGTHEVNEPLIATALREFNEESNCSFKLDDARSLQLSGPSRSGNFFTYHMKIKYQPVSRIAESTACRTDERDQWAWVRGKDLLSALKKNSRPQTVVVAEGEQPIVPLWSVAADALRQALEDKVLPENDPCNF